MPRAKNPTSTAAKKRAPRKPAAARSAPSTRAGTTFTNFVGPEQRAALIAEAAYFRAEKRGFAPWLRGRGLARGGIRGRFASAAHRRREAARLGAFV